MNNILWLFLTGLLVTGCAYEAGLDDDCRLNCRYPEYFSPAEDAHRESAVDIENRNNANKRRNRLNNTTEDHKYGVGVGINSHHEVSIPNTPDYKPSPKEQTWPDVKIKMPFDIKAID